MAETISDLFVGLSLDVEKKSFDEGLSSFRELRKGGLAMATALGTVATAAGLGANALRGMAEERHQIGALAGASDLAVGNIDQLGFALSQLGGDASNAGGVLVTMRDLLDQYRELGEGGLVDAGVFGIDANAIAATTDNLEALLEVSRQLQGMSSANQNLVLDALGLDGTGIANLLRQGPEAFQAYIDTAEQLRTLTQEEIEISRELVQASGELDRAFKELGDELLTKFAPALTSVIEYLTGRLSGEEGPALDSGGVLGVPGTFTEEARRAAESAARGGGQPQGPTGDPTLNELLVAIGAVESGNRHRDAAGNLITSPAGALGRWQIMPETGRDPGFSVMPLQSNMVAEHERFAEDYLTALLREFDGNLDAALAAYNAGPGRIGRLVTQYGPEDFLQHAPRETQDYVDRVGDRLGDLQNPQASINANFNIYGATDPDAVARTVHREITRMAGTTADDFRGQIS